MSLAHMDRSSIIGQFQKSEWFEVASIFADHPRRSYRVCEYMKGYIAWEGLVEPAVSVTNVDQICEGLVD